MKRNIPALKELRRVCVEAPDELFHMRRYVEVASCGTARCMLGWAVIDPAFTKVVADIVPDGWTVEKLDEAEGRRYFWSDAGKLMAEHLGLTIDEGHILFAADISRGASAHSVSKDEVLWNIDELIAGRSPLRYREVVGVYWKGPYANYCSHEERAVKVPR